MHVIVHCLDCWSENKHRRGTDGFEERPVDYTFGEAIKHAIEEPGHAEFMELRITDKVE